MTVNNLNETEVVTRALNNFPEQVKPLTEYLEMEGEYHDGIKKGKTKHYAHKLIKEIRYYGSNNIAYVLRGNEGVKYSEIVYDVGKHLKADVDEDFTPAKNEEIIIEKMFKDALFNMSKAELKEFVKASKIKDPGAINWGSATPIIVQQLILKGGFTSYKMTLIVVNWVAKAILGRGLSLGANVLVTRTLSALAGPIGWIAGGLWLSYDIASPAYRKTVPSVLHVALLRQFLSNQILIGIAGDGSTGKDALLSTVFNLAGMSHPVAGSTTEWEKYDLPTINSAVFNFPGFNDIRANIEDETNDLVKQMDVFIMVLDITRGVTDIDKEVYNKLKNRSSPVLVCANKADLSRSRKDLNDLMKAAKERLDVPEGDLVATSFDPDPRLGQPAFGAGECRKWITETLNCLGKSADDLFGALDKEIIRL